MASAPDGGSGSLSPDQAFALLGNETRVGILQALWDAFESGTRDNAVAYSDLFAAVDIRDSGNFAYHLEKLTGPFVRKTEVGYELKQTGINVVRAVVAGTVTDDPEIAPTVLDIACPLCRSPIEVAYADELISARCTACDGIIRWNDEAGFLFLGIVPPAVIERPTTEGAFRTGVAYVLHQMSMFHDGICPHCSSAVETTVNVCENHAPKIAPDTLCAACDRAHLAEAWMVCSRCKRSMFPPVQSVLLHHPAVSAFYHEHGVTHRTETWEGLVRRFDVREELVSAEPIRVRFSVPAGSDELHLTVDERLDVLEITS